MFGLIVLLTACQVLPKEQVLKDQLSTDCQNQVECRGEEETSQVPPSNEYRVALVIGNGNYQKAPLANPTNDADDMGDVLKQVGFEVIKLKNASLKEMKMAINIFSQKLRNADVGLFYFAGHGIQHQGENYLFPIGAMKFITVAEHLPFETLNIGYALATMKGTKNLNIVILDACRNNPFRYLLKKSRGLDQEGLALIAVPSGTLIAYATRPNRRALDGNGRNSPYVKYLKQELPKPKIRIEEMLRRVRVAVMRETKDFQAPGYYSELSQPFCFVGQCPPMPSNDESEPLVAHCAVPQSNVQSQIFRDRLEEGSEGPEMVWLPAGQFKMGDIQGRGFSNELPVQKVFVNKFAMGRYEVTFAEYDHFVKATGRAKPDDEGWGRGKQPVINVSWEEATAYTEWLSQQTGKKYRLPTEVEWEYAARAGTETQYWWGNEMMRNCAVCDGCGSDLDDKKTAPVGYFPANAFGLHDTVSNVWEWTCSEYQEQYSGKEQSCADKQNVEYRVTRGGSWFTIPQGVRAAYRFKLRPTEHYNEVGFRVVRM